MARVEVEWAVTHRYRATLDVPFDPPFVGALGQRLSEWPKEFEDRVLDGIARLDDNDQLPDPRPETTLLVAGRVVAP